MAAGHEPFDVVTGDAGGKLGGKRGGVVWLRLAKGGHEVAQLSLDLDHAIGSGTYTATSGPRPHLTVARNVTAAALEDLRVVASQVILGWTVDRIVLFRSHTDPAGSRYEDLSSATAWRDALTEQKSWPSARTASYRFERLIATLGGDSVKWQSVAI